MPTSSNCRLRYCAPNSARMSVLINRRARRKWWTLDFTRW
jgi:hypothetical protein